MMTGKERWLAAIKCEPLDRLPFWPKIYGGAYTDHQNKPFCDMDVYQIHDWIGSDKHEYVGNFYKETRKYSSIEVIEKGNLAKTIYKTSAGCVETIKQYDSPSQSWHPVKFPVVTLNDLKIMTQFYSDCQIDLDFSMLEASIKCEKQYGENASTYMNIGESPLMEFVEWLAGVENAHYLLADYREEVEALFAAMQSRLLKIIEIVAEYCPADMVYMIENTSTTLISPVQFRTYCFKHLQEYGTILNQANRLLVLHMCGHLKAILPDIAKLNANAIEAFTSPTLGNTTLLDGRTVCPDKGLIGGTNAVLWTKDAKTIIGKLEEDLSALPHHRGIVVTSAGVMPPLARPETIREVCEWVKSYSVKT